MIILDAKEHSRLIANSEQVCIQAGIQSHFLYESMVNHCGADEIEWVVKYWDHKTAGHLGLLLHHVARPDTRCQAIAAALVRNFVDARVIPVNTLIDAMMNEGVPSPSVLLIPNLYMTMMSKHAPAWRTAALYDLLLERSIRGKPSVVYVEDMKGLAKMYGPPFRDFLDRFIRVED